MLSTALASVFLTATLFGQPIRAQTPPGFSPSTSKSLGVTFPNSTTVEYPGIPLSENETKYAPRLDLHSLSSCSPSAYMAFMIDIDIVREGQSAHLLHWYQPDLALAASTHELVVTCSDRKAAQYGGPSPPAGSVHRYVELVFRQPANFTFPEQFEHHLEPTIPARLFFNITEFARAAGLEQPVAATYFNVSGVATEGIQEEVMEL